MIKTKCVDKDVTIRKVTVTLNKNIENVLLNYVGRRKVEAIIAYLKKEIEGTQLVIAEIGNTMFELKFVYNVLYGAEPTFEKFNFEGQISGCLFDNGLTDDEVAECVPLLYSLNEVPYKSNEEKSETQHNGVDLFSAYDR